MRVRLLPLMYHKLRDFAVRSLRFARWLRAFGGVGCASRVLLIATNRQRAIAQTTHAQHADNARSAAITIRP